MAVLKLNDYQLPTALAKACGLKASQWYYDNGSFYTDTITNDELQAAFVTLDVLQIKKDDDRQLMICTPYQLKRALNTAGKFTLINTAVNSLEDDNNLKIGWLTASKFSRLRDEVLEMAALFTISDDEMDAIFIDALTY